MADYILADPGVILIRDTAMVDMMREKYGHEFDQ
jgi:hypothetical protein